MQINILHCLDGAKYAEGLTVIIDVFRAFSLEAYIMDKNPRELRPIGDYLLPLEYKKNNNDIVIIGERHAIKLDGYDYGNSPTEIADVSLEDKVVYHTTSAGTQGIENAVILLSNVDHTITVTNSDETTYDLEIDNELISDEEILILFDIEDSKDKYY